MVILHVFVNNSFVSLHAARKDVNAWYGEIQGPVFRFVLTRMLFIKIFIEQQLFLLRKMEALIWKFIRLGMSFRQSIWDNSNNHVNIIEGLDLLDFLKNNKLDIVGIAFYLLCPRMLSLHLTHTQKISSEVRQIQTVQGRGEIHRRHS